MDQTEKNPPHGELHGMFVVELFNTTCRHPDIPAGAIYQGSGKYLVTSGRAMWSETTGLSLQLASGVPSMDDEWVNEQVHTISLYGAHTSAWINPSIF